MDIKKKLFHKLLTAIKNKFYLSDVSLKSFDPVASDDKPKFESSEPLAQRHLPMLEKQNSFGKIHSRLWMADAKRTPSYSSDLHFLVLHYRPDRGTLICSKICSKKL